MRRTHSVGAGLFILAISLQARAQNAGQPTPPAAAVHDPAAAALPTGTKQAARPIPPSASSHGALEEVTVTAQRRTQNLQDVPIAISNFSARDIEQQQINATADIPRLVPNMFTNNVVGTGSGNVYFLRGLGQTESFPTFDPQVGTYVDDIYIGRESASNFGLFDLSQIQVLRGPQGTLFGRNSTGGAIVITLAKPTSTFGGYLDAGYGAYNRVFGKGSVNIPLRDDVLTKFSFYGVRDDGYVEDRATDDRLNAHNDWGVRESVTIAPHAIENLSWNMSGDYSESGYNAEQNAPDGSTRVSYSGFGDLSAPVPAIGAAPIIADFDAILKRPVSSLANGEDIKTGGFMSNVQLDFDNSKLNLISGLRAQEQLGASDFPFPGASGPIIPYDENELGQFGIVLHSIDRQYSQEIKWTGHYGPRLSYTAGGFYLYEENTSDFLETLTVPLTPTAVEGLELPGPQHFHNTTESQALYSQVDYKLTQALSATVGARVTHEEKNFEASGRRPDGYDTADVLAAGNRTSLTTDQLTPRFVLQYQIDPQLMSFISATRGFQGGGWNSLSSSAVAVSAFGPETLWTYETGVRYETPSRRLRINADIFFNDVKNFQAITLGPGTANFITENAAGLINYGFEADIAYKPIRSLTLSSSVGLQTGHYVDPSQSTQIQQAACKSGVAADCAQGILNANGNLAQLQDFPPFTLSANMVYDTDFRDLHIQPAAGLQLAAASHVDTEGTNEGLSPFHYIVDLGVKFQFHNSPWSFTAECQNCTLQNYQATLLFVKYYNNPGIWDVKLHRSF